MGGYKQSIIVQWKMLMFNVRCGLGILAYVAETEIPVENQRRTYYFRTGIAWVGTFQNIISSPEAFNTTEIRK